MASGAWGRVRQPVVTRSLSEVMSEELATQLESEEKRKAEDYAQQREAESAKEKELFQQLSCEEGDTSSDVQLAMLLQAQFDAEYEEAKSEPVKLSFNYPLTIDDDEDDEEDDEEGEDDEFPGPAFTVSASKGYSGSGANIRTKHDLELCATRNAERMLDCMDPDIAIGNVAGKEHRLSSQVYNGLKRAGHSEQRRCTRLQEKKDRSTAERALDEPTRRALYRLEAQDRLRELGGIVATGKESVVLHALGGASCTQQGVPFPDECAVKVYKTTLNEFKSRVIYVNGDFRFSRDEFRKQNPRKVIRMWAEKEMMNLKKIYAAGISCPKPIILTRHVLVMSFIGSNGYPAKQLKDATLSYDEWEIAYHQTLDILRRLLKECNLVHADLSCYNLLWHSGQVWVIDVSQSVDRTHPHALSFLRRDCENVCTFFAGKGVITIGSEALFNELTGLDLKGHGKDFIKSLANYLAATQDFESNQEWLSFGESRRDFAFDFFFEEEVKKRERSAADKKEEVSSVHCSSSSIQLKGGE